MKSTFCLAEDIGHRLWCGNPSEGMAVYDTELDSAKSWLISNIGTLDNGPSALSIDDKGTLWIGTSNGLHYLLDAHNISLAVDNIIEKFHTLQLPCDEQSITSLFYHQNHLIFGTEMGHGYIDLNSHYSHEGETRIEYYNTRENSKGGGTEEHAISVDGTGAIWIIKKHGILKIDWNNRLRDTSQFELEKPIFVAGNDTINNSGQSRNVDLPLLKRSLAVSIKDSFNGFLSASDAYEYRLQRPDIPATTIPWRPIESRHLILNYLSPGTYSLELRCKKDNLISDSQQYSLFVPFTMKENPHFWTAVLITLALILSGTSYIMFKSHWNRRKAELQLEKMHIDLDTTRIKSITSSLNPHFINNSLHWLQSKVRKDKEAVAMIGRLSENIRTIFHHSRNSIPHHSLESELKLVKNYLLIQKLRYGDDLESEIPHMIELQHLLSYDIPIMQIQIHTENSIEHGLRNKKAGGHISIDINEDDRYLYITITDNGVGRKRAKELGSEGTQQGLQMLNDLHNILNKRNINPILTQYHDDIYLDPYTGIKYGTSVKISVPKQYDYVIK